jgi:hypothetical protein
MQLAYAVVRVDPPKVFVADDIDTLQWVLALQLVARTRPSDLAPGTADTLREALLGEEWGRAVFEWINATDTPVDVYPEIEVYEARHVAMGPAELQFTPLFQGDDA